MTDDQQHQARDGDQKPARKPRRRWLKWFLGLVLLVAAIETLDPYPDSALLRTIFLDKYAYEVSIHLNAEGEDVTISRKIRCVPQHTLRDLRPGQDWLKTLGAAGTTLPSGHGVMAMLPHFRCGPTLENEQALKRLTQNYLPLIGWVEDPKTFDTFEVFYDPKYFERNYAKVKYNGMNIREISYYKFVDDKDKYGFFGNTSPGRLVPGRGIQKDKEIKKTYAFYIVEIPRGIWSEYSDLESHLGVVINISEVSNEKYWVDGKYEHKILTDLRSRSIKWYASIGGRYLSTSSYFKYNLDYVPFIFENGVYVEERNNIGMLEFRVIDRKNLINDLYFYINDQMVTVSPIKRTKDRWIVFDPKEKKLFAIQKHSMSVQNSG